MVRSFILAASLLLTSFDEKKEEERGLAFEKEGNFHQALEVYRSLYEQHREDMDLLCKVGRMYGMIKEWSSAEAALKECLQKDPGNVDAEAFLSYVYYWQGKYQEAKVLAEKIIREHPNYMEVHLLMGGLLHAERHYESAYQKYLLCFQKEPSNRLAERGLIATKPLVRPSIEARSLYVQEREQDLLTPVTTTQMTTINEALTLIYPINDRWRPYLEGVYDLQIQHNLVAKVNNYQVNSYFQNIGTFVQFGNFWTLDLESRIHFARNKGGSNLLPFHNRTLWEPQAELRYTTPDHFFILSGEVDSLIARLFPINQSQLIARKGVTTAYEYRFQAPFNGIGGTGNVAWYGHSVPNREHGYSAWVRFRIPSAVPDFLIRYEFAYKGFHKVVGAYNSFKWRNQHLARVTYHKEWMPKGYFDLSYSWLWSDTHQLTDQTEIILPGEANIPTPIQKNIFHANIVDVLFHYVARQSIHFEGRGRYYHDTNRYRAWALFGSFEYVF